MHCQHVRFPGGGTALVCGPKPRRCKCGNAATLLCDWKMPSRKSGTCDAPICERCATTPAPGKDLCPKHAEAFEQWRQSRGDLQLKENRNG